MSTFVEQIAISLDLGNNEIKNLVIDKLSAEPSTGLTEGRIYYNSTDNKYGYYDGTAWQYFETASHMTTELAKKQGNLKTDSTLSLATEADSNGKYEIKVVTTALDKATASTVGVVKGGSNISVDSNGELDLVNGTVAFGKLSSGAVTTSIAAANTASDQKLPTEKAVRTLCDAVAEAAQTATKIDGETIQRKVTEDAHNGELYVRAATTSATGVIEIADADEIAAGTATDKAVTPAQLANKVEKNAAITAGTGTVVTYDAKGLVTGSSELGIKSGSTDYLEYDSTNHQFGAKVDTTVTASSTNLVTSGAVKSAIDSAIAGGVRYAGTWDITSATDYSGISLPQKKGALFYVTGTGPKTVGGVEWNAGDYLLFNSDVASGGTVTGKVEKIDNTESTDIVRLDAQQTLTAKTIDADNNTILDLTTSNLKSGVLQTSVRNSSAATDTTLASEKAVRTELDTKQDKVVAAVENHLATWDNAGNTKDSGKAFVTTLGPASGDGAATNDQVPTALAVATAVKSASDSAAAAAHIVVIPTSNESNFQLESGASPESATWTVATPWTGHDVLSAKLLDSNGNEVHCHIQYGMTKGNNPVGYVEFGINCSASDTFTVGAYKALIVG